MGRRLGVKHLFWRAVPDVHAADECADHAHANDVHAADAHAVNAYAVDAHAAGAHAVDDAYARLVAAHHSAR